jgi:hypothetical protein
LRSSAERTKAESKSRNAMPATAHSDTNPWSVKYVDARLRER